MFGFGELYVGHKLNTVAGAVFILGNLLHFALVPVDMVDVDSGSPDSCSDVTRAGGWLVPLRGEDNLDGASQFGHPPNANNNVCAVDLSAVTVTNCAPNCNAPCAPTTCAADQAACEACSSAWTPGRLDFCVWTAATENQCADVFAERAVAEGDECGTNRGPCRAILSTHLNEAACPGGCYFTPQHAFEETSRAGDLIVRILLGVMLIVPCGMMEDPVRLCGGKGKLFSLIAIPIFALGGLGYAYYLWYISSVLPVMCEDHGHTWGHTNGVAVRSGPMSVTMKAHYGGENHFCEQFKGDDGRLIGFAIFIDLAASTAAVVGGSMVMCCMPDDGEKDSSG